MEGYCERHHQPWDIKWVSGRWVCECPKCHAEGLLDIFYDTKTTMRIQQEIVASNHVQESHHCGQPIEWE